MLSKRPKDGFTLVELLIAASIFSLILISLYSAFQAGILSYKRIDSAFEVYQAARIIFNRIESDLKNSFLYSADESRFKGEAQAIEFFSAIDTFEKGSIYPGACRIKYAFKDASLKRFFYQGADAFKEGLDSQGEDLSSDIKEVSFQYACLADTPEKPYAWLESWPQTTDVSQRKIIPLAVKIKLSLIEKSRGPQQAGIIEFTKIVALPLSGKSTAVSSGGGTSGE